VASRPEMRRISFGILGAFRQLCASLDALPFLDAQTGIGRQFDLPDFRRFAANRGTCYLRLDEDLAVHTGMNDISVSTPCGR
jgi:hypothetical protein